MLNHDELREQLHDLIDGKLSSQDADGLLRHLQGCGECARELEALQSLKSAAADLNREIAPPVDLWTGISARLDPSAAAGRTGRSRFTGLRHDRLRVLAALLAFAIILPPSLSRLDNSGNAMVGDLDNTTSLMIDDCRLVLARSGNSLPRDANTAIDDGLSLLDKSIRETRQAMSDVADTPEEFSRLATGYRQKLDLLQRVTRYTAKP